MVERVSTYGMFQSTLSYMTRTFGDLSELQIQVSSGLRSQNFAGIYDGARQYMQLEDQISRTNHYLSGNNIIDARVKTTSNILSQVVNTGTQLKTLIAQRRTAALDAGAFQTQIESIWQTFTSQLNTQLEGRYLFAGGKTDVKPVDEDTFPVLGENDEPVQTYYHGDNSDLTATIADGINITYNTRANEEGFQKIFAALAAAKEGDTFNSDPQLEHAYELLTEGLDDVIVLQAKANANTVQIADTKLNLSSLQIYWKSLSEEIVNTDLVAASTQVAVNQGILQASLQLFARINSLKLSDYL